MTLFQPADAAELREVVADAARADETLAISGGGSKRGFGRPVEATHQLDLRRLSGIIDYDPSELVLTAHAATPMAEILGELRQQNQMLAFEPPDWSGLLPGGGAATLGGTIACNLAGPRRVRAGAARDHFLGFTAVNGLGEVWKSGGRVVKNVTGYDLSKLMAGAFGTLSVLQEITVRLVPRPETSCSVIVAGRDDEAAIRLLADGLNTPHEVTAAAHLPATVAARVAPASLAGLDQALTVLRLEGHGPSVAFRADALATALGASAILDETESAALWSAIGAVQPLFGPHDSIIWRLCPTPSQAPAVLRKISASLPTVESFYDWGGGLLWIALDAAAAGADGGASVIRGAMAEIGGHATLLRATESLRRAVPVFDPPQGGLAALSRRIKASFDPKGILNPGRLHEGY